MSPRTIIRTEDRLLKYAGWYALRYMPSCMRLREALMKKSEDDAQLTEKVMERMSGYIREDRTIDSLVRAWIGQGKSESYIRIKLREKRFDPSIVENVIEQYREWFSDWNTYRKTIEQKIRTLSERGKSKVFIAGTLNWKYPGFSSQIRDLLDMLCPDDTVALRQELQKMLGHSDSSDPRIRQKIFRRLMARGFSYEAIRMIISE